MRDRIGGGGRGVPNATIAEEQRSQRSAVFRGAGLRPRDARHEKRILRDLCTSAPSASNRLCGLRFLRVPALALTLACWIAWPQDVVSHGTLTTTVLFDREIVRILNNHCVMCHDDGALAFPLATYEQTWLRRNAVRSAILGRHTPWPAVAGYGQFVNANSLTLREKQFVVGWVEGLGPRNAGSVFLNVADAGAGKPEPEVRATSHAGHWQLGEPDVTRLLGARTIPARQALSGKTVVDLGLTSERRIRALEFMPGDRRVVRAATFTIEQTGQWLGSWTPWYGFTSLPAGVAYRLPAGSRVVAEIHYRGTSEPVVETGTLGVFFAAPSATRAASDLILDGRPAPPSASSTRLRATARVAADTHVWALRPEFGSGVRSIEVSARGADGSTEILLFAKDPSTDWPTPFILEQPRLIRRGTELSLVAHRTGPAQPAAPVRVTLSRY